MFDADVYPLFDVSVPNDLVDDDANSVRSHVIHDSRTTVIELVRHALLLRCIRFNVDDITNTVVCEESGQFNGTMF